MDEIQRKKLARFRDMHFSDEVLVTPNAWDVVSAKIYELEGFKCVATTSAGIAHALGISDVERMTIDENLSVVKRITAAIDVPVTADMEACYTNDHHELHYKVGKIIESGAVGINIEDSPGFDRKPLHEMGFQAEKLTAVREASRHFGFDLFINARIDAWMFLEFSKEEKISECLKRAETYLAAGADSIFIPDLEDMDEETIATLVNGIDAPLNIIAGSSTPAVSRLYELGVKRLSFGPRPMRAVLSLLKEIAREVNVEGTYELMSESSISYSEMNQWFLGRK